MRYGSGCVPAARSWKSVRFPPNEFVDTTDCERKRVSQMGHCNSTCCSVVIGTSRSSPRPPLVREGKNCASLVVLRAALVRVLSYYYHSASELRRAAHPCPGRMLINLLPDFFAVLDSNDRLAAYQRYFATHQKI